ncbi:MAG: AAA family ATPase [Bacteroidetes bacterium]|nr:AAA family ATPase [Bacteroidota bacterium]
MKKEETEILRAKVKTLIQQKLITVKQLGTILGKSSATASLWLKGDYSGDNHSLELIISDWLERKYEEEQNDQAPTSILQTAAFDYITNNIKEAHLRGDFRVVYGEAGVGKTEACRFYASQIPNVILVEVRTSFTTLFFMQLLHKMVGLSGIGSLPELNWELEQKLKGSKRLLIVDEAEYLPRRALDLLRNLHDHTGIGVVLVGMPQLMLNLRGKRQDFRQLYSRISTVYNVKECADEDVKMVISSFFPDSNGLWKAFAGETRNMRSLMKLIQGVKYLSKINNLPPSKELVYTAVQTIIL